MDAEESHDWTGLSERGAGEDMAMGWDEEGVSAASGTEDGEAISGCKSREEEMTGIKWTC